MQRGMDADKLLSSCCRSRESLDLLYMMLANIFNAHIQAIDLRFLQQQVQRKVSELLSKYQLQASSVAAPILFSSSSSLLESRQQSSATARQRPCERQKLIWVHKEQRQLEKRKLAEFLETQWITCGAFLDFAGAAKPSKSLF